MRSNKEYYFTNTNKTEENVFLFMKVQIDTILYHD